MIKRLCVTTVPARAIGSTRENCVHSVETDFALYSAGASVRSQRHVHPSHLDRFEIRRLMTA